MFREGLVEGALVLFLFFVCLVWFGLVWFWVGKRRVGFVLRDVWPWRRAGRGRASERSGRGGGGGVSDVFSSTHWLPTTKNVVLDDVSNPLSSLRLSLSPTDISVSLTFGASPFRRRRAGATGCSVGDPPAAADAGKVASFEFLATVASPPCIAPSPRLAASLDGDGPAVSPGAPLRGPGVLQGRCRSKERGEAEGKSARERDVETSTDLWSGPPTQTLLLSLSLSFFTFFRPLVFDDKVHRIEQTKPRFFSVTLSLFPACRPVEQRRVFSCP